MSLLKLSHSKPLNYYSKGSSTPLSVSIFNASNNEYDLISDITEKLYILALDPYYADVTEQQIDTTMTYTLYFKNEGTARFKIIYEYTDQLGRDAKEIEIIEFVCYEPFYSTNYKTILPSFDYNIIYKNTKLRVILENIFEMFDILHAYSFDAQNMNNPILIKSKFLETLGRDIGFERLDTEDVDTRFEAISTSLYRALLGTISRILKLKGTPLSYQLFFNALGYEIAIKEYWWDDVSHLVEIDTSNPIGQSSFDLYDSNSVFLGKKSTYDPRTKVTPGEIFKNAKSNYISVQLSALKDNLGNPVDYAPDVQTLSVNKKRILKEYLQFLRPQHIQYLNDIIKFSLEFDGNNYELLDFLNLISEEFSAFQLISINNTLPPLIKYLPNFDLYDLEDELWMIDWSEYYLINNEQSFDVFFSVDVDPISSGNTANYRIVKDSVDISSELISAAKVGANSVRLTFSSTNMLGKYEIYHTGIYSPSGKVYENANNIENPNPLKMRLTDVVMQGFVQGGSGPIVPFQLIQVKAKVGNKVELTFNNNLLPSYPALDKLKNKVTTPTTTTLTNFKIYKTNNNQPLVTYYASIPPLQYNKVLIDVAPMEQGAQYTFEILDASYIHTNNNNTFFSGPLTFNFNGLGEGYNEDGILLPPAPPESTWQETLDEYNESQQFKYVTSLEGGVDVIQEPVKWNYPTLFWGGVDLYWGKAAFFEDDNMIRKKENPTDINNAYSAIDIDAPNLFLILGEGLFTLAQILSRNWWDKLNEDISKDRRLYYEVKSKKINTLRMW